MGKGDSYLFYFHFKIKKVEFENKDPPLAYAFCWTKQVFAQLKDLCVLERAKLRTV